MWNKFSWEFSLITIILSLLKKTLYIRGAAVILSHQCFLLKRGGKFQTNPYMEQVSISLLLLSAGWKAWECALGILCYHSVRTVCESCLWPSVADVFPQKLKSLLPLVFQEMIRVNVTMLKSDGEFHKAQVCPVFQFIQWINVQWNKVCVWMQMHCFLWCQSVWCVPLRTEL